MNPKNIIAVFTIILLFFCQAGCSRKPVVQVNIAYEGDTKEAPLIIAYEKEFFKKENIDVRLVKLDFESIKDGIAKGDIQGATFDHRVFEAVDKGCGIKLVAGLHSGCTQIIINENSKITSLKDLGDKTIGIINKGDASMVVTAALFSENGLGEKINWDIDTEESLRKKLKDQKIDAISILEASDPAKRVLGPGEKVLYSSSDKDNEGKSYKHFYESFIGFSDEFINKYRKTAFNTSIAWLKAAQWVSDNDKDAYKLLVDKGYAKDDYETVLKKAQYYMWMPGVKYARDHIETYASGLKSQGIIKSELTQKDFVKRIFEPLIPELNGR